MKFSPAFAVLTALFSLAIGPGVARANNIYIAQTAAGAANGSSCANAYAYGFFNAAANWGTGANQIGPGSIVHLCGTITAELAFQGSGTSGNVITLLFETGAKIQISPGMDSNGAINLSNNYILIDGGTGQPCGWNTATNASEGSCNGQVENMLYGSSDGACPGGTCTTQSASTGWNLIKGNGGSNIEIRNLRIGPSYIHTSTGNSGNDGGGTGCVDDWSGSNWNVHDNLLDDGAWCLNVEFASGTTSNVSITNNYFRNNSHHVAVDGTQTLNGITFSGNFFGDMCTSSSECWDTTGDDWHGDAIHFYTSAGSGTLENVTINNNIFGGNTGGDVTGQIFSEEFTTISNVAIFNNLFIMSTSPDVGSSNHAWGPAQCSSGCYVLNNTVARQTVTGGNFDLGFSTYAMVATLENNVNQGASYLATVSASSPSLTLDYNAYGPFGNGWQYKKTSYGTFASWQSASGEGAHSFYNSSLGLNGTFQPSAGSPLIGAGVNVCTQNPTFCTNYPAIQNDIAGNARPSSGAWDIGAYQHVGSAPVPPTGLSAVAK